MPDSQQPGLPGDGESPEPDLAGAQDNGSESPPVRPPEVSADDPAGDSIGEQLPAPAAEPTAEPRAAAEPAPPSPPEPPPLAESAAAPAAAEEVEVVNRQRRIRSDDISDAGDLTPEEREAGEAEAELVDWANEGSVVKIARELRHIEREVRDVLGDRDPKRKRKLAGTQRWRELEEDLLSLRYSGRYGEEDLDRLALLVRRRHFLFKRLTFLTSTRPVWNS